MNHWSKISVLLLTLVLPGYAMAMEDTLSYYESAEIHPIKGTNFPSASPANKSGLFAVHPPAESGIDLLNHFSEAYSINDSENDTFASPLVETAAQKYASTCLQIYDKTGRSLSIKKLIFPFHSFL